MILLLGDGMGDRRSPRRATTRRPPALNVDRLPLTGGDTTWSVKPGAATPTCPTTCPTRPPPAPRGRPVSKTLDERISQGPSSVIDVPGANLPTVLERPRSAAAGPATCRPPRSPTRRRRCWPRTYRRGCQGPADMAKCPQYRPPAAGLDRRADGRPRGRRRARRRPGPLRQTLTGGRTRARRSSSHAQARATSSSPTRTASAGDHDTASRSSASSTRATWRSSGTARTRRPSRPTGPTAPPHGARDQRPASEPSIADMTTKALSLLDRRAGARARASSCRSRARRSTSGPRREPVRSRSERPSRSTRRSGSRSPTSAAHPDTLVVVTADHGHTSQIVAEDRTARTARRATRGPVTKDGQTIHIAYGTAAA